MAPVGFAFMNEFELIARLTQGLPQNDSVVVGAGDDCAVIDLGLPDRWVLFKTDAVVEGIHFDREAPPARVGHKALGRCLSDVAAMAGEPVCALIALGLPPNHNPGYLHELYQGLNALAESFGVAVVGGETTANPERMTVTVSLMGTVLKDRCVRRSGAQVGDSLWVTGELGGSIAGWHLMFEPRLQQARWLADHFPPHAMIDLSDGIAGDLRHLLAASRVGATLLTSAIPISAAARQLAGSRNRGPSPLTAALTDGEDYELLFALPAQQAVALHDAWTRQFPGLRLSCIGKVVAQPGISLMTPEGGRPLTEQGYVHFE